MSRAVTDADFRMPEFRDAKPDDYEFGPDGMLVRKDRWEMAVRKIACILGVNRNKFEISDVIDAAKNAVLGFPDEHIKTARIVFEGSPQQIEVLDYLDALLTDVENE